MFKVDSSHGESCEKVTEGTIWKNDVLSVHGNVVTVVSVHGKTDNSQFLPC
jgi:hypothetical protein